MDDTRTCAACCTPFALSDHLLVTANAHYQQPLDPASPKAGYCASCASFYTQARLLIAGETGGEVDEDAMPLVVRACLTSPAGPFVAVAAYHNARAGGVTRGARA